MELVIKLFLCLFGIQLRLSVCRGTTTIVSNGHTAVAVVVGSRSTLTCSSSDATIQHAFNWMGPDRQYIAYTTGLPGSPCSLVPGADRNHYNVSAPSDGSYCNLIILNGTTDEAGSYKCGDGAEGAMVYLIVLISGPHCSTDAMHDTVVYPGQVTMNCSVQYNTSSGWIPSLQWNTTDSTFSGTSGSTTYTSFTYNTSASTPIPSYSCSVVYNSSVFVDIPSCSTNQVTVFWCPTAVSISGAPNDLITFGNNLTCSASGNPGPTYQWFNSTNNLLSSSPWLTVSKQDNYTCTASNNVSGSPCSASVSQFVNAGSTPGANPLGLGLGLGIPCLLLIMGSIM